MKELKKIRINIVIYISEKAEQFETTQNYILSQA